MILGRHVFVAMGLITRARKGFPTCDNVILDQIQTEEPCWSPAEPLVPSVNMHLPIKPACQSPSPSASRSIIVRDRRLSRASARLRQRRQLECLGRSMASGVGDGWAGPRDAAARYIASLGGARWCKVVRRRRCLCGAAVHGLGTT